MDEVVWEIKTLGQFDVLKNGRSLVKVSGGAKKIWELFMFMFTSRDRVFTPEMILEQLWNDEEYTDPRSTLRRQMHRLKGLLEEDEIHDEERLIVHAQGNYRWNLKLAIKSDMDTFQQLCDRAEQSKQKEQLMAALALYQEAFDIYRGDYLSEFGGNAWLLVKRNLLKHQYIDAVLSYLSLLQDNSDFKRIVCICEKAIQVEPYEELFHYHLIEALRVKGELYEAIEHFHRTNHFFQKELGVSVGHDLLELYQRLLNSRDMIESETHLQHVFESTCLLENALYCEPEVFKTIYELEKRRNERSLGEFCVAALTVRPFEEETYAQMQRRILRLKAHLMINLRKGDILTLWNDKQFLLLLPGMDKETMKQVLIRILKLSEDACKINIEEVTQLHLPNMSQKYHI